MPFKSKAQQGYLYAKHPEVAKKFEAETSNWDLPEHVKKHKSAEENAHSYAEERNKSRKSRG